MFESFFTIHLQILLKGFQTLQSCFIPFYFFENNVEIDFYVPSEQLAIQVSMQILDNIDTKERETKAFTKLKNFIPDITCLLITNSEEAVLECNDIVIDVVPAWKWLLDAADTSSH